MKRTSLPLHRREFIALLGGAAAAWPLAARAQQGERVRRIGVLLDQRPTIRNLRPASRHFCRAAAIGLERRPQRADRNRWAVGDADNIRKYAMELAALAPDVILARAPRPWRRCCRRLALCRSCLNVADPVGAGFVDSLARPGGNATGFCSSNMA